jgi:CRP/FNR family transcriptional regulator, cyclic AMP receptor protein
MRRALLDMRTLQAAPCFWRKSAILGERAVAPEGNRGERHERKQDLVHAEMTGCGVHAQAPVFRMSPARSADRSRPSNAGLLLLSMRTTRTLSAADNLDFSMSSVENARRAAMERGWLAGAPHTFRAAVLERAAYRNVKTGATIFSCGDPPGGLFFLASGALKFSVLLEEQGPTFAHLMWPGAWFGEGPLIMDSPRFSSVVAARPSELLGVSLASMNEVFSKDPGAWRYMAKLAFINTLAALGGAADLMIRDPAKRFIATLLRVAGCRTMTPREAESIEISASQEELAFMSNIARSSVNEILGKLQNDGYVQLSYRRIVIKAPEKLRRMLSD